MLESSDKGNHKHRRIFFAPEFFILVISSIGVGFLIYAYTHPDPREAIIFFPIFFLI
jgi:hypothetical protein